MSDQEKITLTCVLSVIYAVIGSAFTTGWNLSVCNLPANYITCWIQAVYDNDLSKNCTDANDMYKQGDFDEVTGIWAWASSSVALGACLGAVLGGPAAEKFGRKWSMFANSILGIAAMIVLGLSKSINSYVVFILMRVLIGINSESGFYLV